MRMLIAVLLVAACGKNNEPPPPSTGTPMAEQESGPKAKPSAMNADEQAHKMFETVCAMCHGADGTGNGPAAANLNPKPRNYTDPAWQKATTDAQIKEIIVKGGQGVGKSPLMPPNPDLESRPQVVSELVAVVRAVGR